jgi:hypothetical protein
MICNDTVFPNVGGCRVEVYHYSLCLPSSVIRQYKQVCQQGTVVR